MTGREMMDQIKTATAEAELAEAKAAQTAERYPVGTILTSPAGDMTVSKTGAELVTLTNSAGQSQAVPVAIIDHAIESGKMSRKSA